MALTLTIRDRGVMGDLRFVQGSFAADASWLAAGESFTASDLGLDTILLCEVESQGGIVFNWSRSANTILAYRTGSAENAVLTVVANAQNIAAVASAVEFFVLGK